MLIPTLGQEARLSTKSNLGGIAYSSDSYSEIYRSLCAWMRGNRQTTRLVGYVNPHVFNLARVNPMVRDFLAQADIVTVDGIGFVLGLHLVKAQRVERTIMTRLFDRFLATDDLPLLTAMLIGGSQDEANRAANMINQTSARIRVVQACHGFHPLAEYLTILQGHEHLDLVLVGMGTPRSEELLLKARDLHPGTLCWAIGGGTIQYYAGTKRRVPKMISTLGLQWVHRMVREPRTIPRYLVGIPVYFGHLLRILLAENRQERAP
jgi:exopolysaccharide biosynthesis WecB/TagA/CpsF family protein